MLTTIVDLIDKREKEIERVRKRKRVGKSERKTDGQTEKEIKRQTERERVRQKAR